MPYLRCPNCGLTVYSASSYAADPSCPECCSRLNGGERLFHDANADHLGTLTRHLFPDVTAPARARRALSELRGPLGNGRYPDIELMLSELISNALRHGQHGGGLSIRLQIDALPALVRVTVGDDGLGFEPPALVANVEGADGRGLLIVDRLSDRWGVDAQAPTSVWFEVDG